MYTLVCRAALCLTAPYLACVSSHKHPVPQGQQLDYGVVLGYALHK